MYLKNGLAEKKEGEWGRKWGRKGRKERGNREYNGKGKEMGRNTFLSPCLSRSAAKQNRPTKEKKFRSFLRAFWKSTWNSKYKKLQSDNNKYHRAHWTKKQWPLRPGTPMVQCSPKVTPRNHPQNSDQASFQEPLSLGMDLLWKHWNHRDAQSTRGLPTTWCTQGGTEEKEEQVVTSDSFLMSSLTMFAQTWEDEL